MEESIQLAQRLTRRQLIVVMGKGGVGKSALTAVLGRHLAARGRRTLLLEVDPRENLHQLLDIPPSGGEIAGVAEGLFLQNLKPLDVLDWLVERQVKIGMLVRRVRKSAIYQRFAESAPGLLQMAILGHALRLVRGELGHHTPAIDTVILDAPATGHGIYLLTAPRLVTEAIGEGPIAELARDVADFVDAAERTGLVIVTQAEEMPVQEALELRRDLEAQFGRGDELLVVNGLYPPPPAGSGGDELSSLWRHRRRVNEVELERLERDWMGPRVDLPLLPVDQGPVLVRELGTLFGEALHGLGAPGAGV